MQTEQKVIVFPELCVTGYTCSDLFMQDILLKEKKLLFKIADYTKEKDALIFIGVPLAVDGELYNVLVCVKSWKYSGTYDKKTFLPNYGEFYEMRQFRRDRIWQRWITLDGKKIPFGPQLLFVAEQMEELVVFGRDL